MNIEELMRQEYTRRVNSELQPLRYNYSSPHLRYLDRARLFPEDLKEPKMNRSEFRSNPGGFTIKFENGYEVSVQFTKEHYCSNRIDQDDHPIRECRITHTCRDADVAIFNSRGTPFYFNEHETLGWQSPAAVLELMNKVAKL